MESIKIRNAVLAVALAGLATACSADWDPAAARGAAADRGGAANTAAALAAAQDTSGAGLAARLDAMGRAPQASFASLPDKGDLVAYPEERVVRRDGPYTWHRADVSEAHALRAIFDGVLTVTGPSGEQLRFQYDRHVEHASGDWTWIGHTLGGTAAQDAIITFGANAVFGTIARPGQSALSLTIRDGASWLVETDRAALSAASKAAGRYERPDFLVPTPPDAVGSIGGISRQALAPAIAQASTAPTTVDVIIGYTAGFAASLASGPGGNQPGHGTRMNAIVDIANESYVNSGVDLTVRLVHTMQVDYPDATDNTDALTALTGTDGSHDPVLANVDDGLKPLHAARDQYGADLVTLIRRFNHPENVSCGVAWLLGSQLQDLNQAWAPYGYSVVSDGNDGGFLCEDQTYAHELGHNMGLAHDIDTAKGDDGVLQSDEYGHFTYSFGYRTGPANGHFYTVMAYSDDQVINYHIFSNPRVTFCGGFQCGIVNQADNALTLEQTAPIIAQFRDAVVVDPDPDPVPVARNDVNGDGVTDLLWHNATSGHFAYWTMDARSILQSTTIFVGTGFTVIGSGDYNGDGFADIVWQDPNRKVYMWLGDGVGFKSGLVARYAAGWLPVGSDDVDGDGRTDLLWHNQGTGHFAYWRMDGRTLLESAVQFVGTGFSVAGHGDYDGNGLADILWVDANRKVFMWLGNGTDFESGFVVRHAAGWSPVGTGDVDGDGNADILWHNAQTGYFAYWLMDGRQLVTSQSVFVGAGFSVMGTGDYNGDGLVDVSWHNAARDIYIWLGNGVGFKSGYVETYSKTWAPVNDNP